MSRVSAAAGSLLLLLATTSFGWAQTAVAPVVVAQREDAAINDICFVDRYHGWAVGQHGAIWRTEDGGLRWNQQESGVSCGLTSVCFLDRQHGWAVGGWTEPYTHLSHGVVLRTADGGQSWQVTDQLLLPALRQVQFFSSARGMVLGRATAQAPSGVFVTQDGGRSWSPLTSAQQSDWLAAAFFSSEAGLLVGRAGVQAAIRGRSLQAGRPLGDQLRSLQAIAHLEQRQAWAAGQGGWITQTTDAGKTWKNYQGPLPAGVEACDFGAIEMVGAHLWLVGNPGSRVLHSSDGGRSFHWQSTGQTVPLRTAHFVDTQHGWAAGALGTILATEDGGTTWKTQRSGGRQAAWLAVVDRAERVPLELVAQVSASEGYLGVVHEVVRDDLEVPEALFRRDLARREEALLAVGAGQVDFAWQFPVRQPGLRLAPERIVEVWNEQGAQGQARLEEHLVRQIRTWRPHVVFAPAASPHGDDPLGHVVNQLVLTAVHSAADRRKFNWHAEALQLPAWEVRKVYALAAAADHGGQVAVRGSQWIPRLGLSLHDYVRQARGLLATDHRQPVEAHGLQLLIDRRPPAAGGREVFSGIPLEPGGDARRAAYELPAVEVNVLQRLAARQQQLQTLVAAAETDHQGEAARLAQLGRLTEGLAPEAAGWLLFELAQRYRHGGHHRLAAETLRLLLVQLPEHPAGGAAAQWLVQYYGSGEMAHRAGQGKLRPAEVSEVQTAAAEAAIDEPQAVVPLAAALASPEASRQPWLQTAAFWEDRLKQSRPQLLAEPQVAWPLAAVRRLASGNASLEHAFQRMHRETADATWRSCAAAELWLSGRQGNCPKPVWHCRRASSKPLLDGKLTESFWREQPPVVLASRLKDDAEFPALAYCGYDSEFLYLAIRCGAPAELPPLTAGLRRRDEELAGRDRVRLCIDLDRDYTSYYELQIDDRGHTAERCFGDASWNPRWFVANHREDATWTCEIAIPLAALTAEAIDGRTAWAVGLDRIVPGHGFQSWQQPAAVETLPQGFGLLLFE